MKTLMKSLWMLWSVLLVGALASCNDNEWKDTGKLLDEKNRISLSGEIEQVV